MESSESHANHTQTNTAGPQWQPPISSQPEGQPDEPIHAHSAGELVLQWLTYAFWGWTVLALSVLTVTIVTSFIAKSDTGDFTPYGIAAILVLLPISFVCDLFYSKKEPAQKTGAAMAIMVIHAVLFALFAIGALITAVFAQVSLLTSNSDTDGQKVLIVSSLIVCFYYAVTFLRVLNLAKIPRMRQIFRIGMLVTVGIIIVLAIVGPVAKERSLRNDRLIEGSLSTVSSSINEYARSKGELPTSLSQLELEGDAKALIDKNLVEYKPEGKQVPSTTIDLQKQDYSSISPLTSNRTVYRYQLCVTFKEKSSSYTSYSNDRYTSYDDTDGYTDYLSSVYSHPAGNQCYKLKTGLY